VLGYFSLLTAANTPNNYGFYYILTLIFGYPFLGLSGPWGGIILHPLGILFYIFFSLLNGCILLALSTAAQWFFKSRFRNPVLAIITIWYFTFFIPLPGLRPPQTLFAALQWEWNEYHRIRERTAGRRKAKEIQRKIDRGELTLEEINKKYEQNGCINHINGTFSCGGPGI